MTIPNRRWIHILVAALGLALMVGGTVARKPGAAIIGLLIAAVNLQLFRRSGSPRDV
jgi:ABC-type thiamin/hydroxymethylpyrimidine transport system permease subunit